MIFDTFLYHNDSFSSLNVPFSTLFDSFSNQNTHHNPNHHKTTIIDAFAESNSLVTRIRLAHQNTPYYIVSNEIRLSTTHNELLHCLNLWQSAIEFTYTQAGLIFRITNNVKEPLRFGKTSYSLL